MTHHQMATRNDTQFIAETITPIATYIDGGIDLRAFAYPFGQVTSARNTELLEHYTLVRGYSDRGFDPALHLYTEEEMSSGFINSASIDNWVHRNNNPTFENHINQIFEAVLTYGKLVSVSTHSIVTNPRDDDWAITRDRLEEFLGKAQELGIKFYTHKDFFE
jgi:hypothetical protein